MHHVEQEPLPILPAQDRQHAGRARQAPSLEPDAEAPIREDRSPRETGKQHARPFRLGPHVLHPTLRISLADTLVNTRSIASWHLTGTALIAPAAPIIGRASRQHVSSSAAGRRR